jgi:hypothetical protein
MILFIFVKPLGGISGIPLLPLRGYSVSGMYVCTLLVLMCTIYEYKKDKADKRRFFSLRQREK